MNFNMPRSYKLVSYIVWWLPIHSRKISSMIYKSKFQYKRRSRLSHSKNPILGGKLRRGGGHSIMDRISLRASRKADRHQPRQSKDVVDDFFIPLAKMAHQDYPLKVVWKMGFIRLVLVVSILWMLLILTVLLFHVWSCQSSITFFSDICNKDSKVFFVLDTMGLVPKPPLRCKVPLADDPDSIIIPQTSTPDKIVQNLSYIGEDVNTNSHVASLFGGHQTWAQRESSFKLNSTMKVHCGFMRNGAGEMDPADVKYVEKCRFVVASGIFDGYDTPKQPSNISVRSENLFCFLMVVDQKSLNFMKKNATARVDGHGGTWVGIWRLILIKHPPYDESRKNGRVVKLLIHRLFPQAQYSIWIDGTMKLLADPLLILERYLWRGKHTFAIARHKYHQSMYEEANAVKQLKRYARPLVDLQMKIYLYEGMEPWSMTKSTTSDVPEAAIVIREHTTLNNLFSCLWFNEVDLLTPRDQLSFGYVVYRLRDVFNYFMFPNCEYQSLCAVHNHTREHSSAVELVKFLDEFKKNSDRLKESRGGLGLWTPYPGDLNLVYLPPVARIRLNH